MVKSFLIGNFPLSSYLMEHYCLNMWGTEQLFLVDTVPNEYLFECAKLCFYVARGMDVHSAWKKIQILDGGFGTELEAAGYNVEVNCYE